MKTQENFVDEIQNEYFDEMVDRGIIDTTGKPLKCMSCGSTDLGNYNEIIENHWIVEYDVICKHCGCITGHWVYGGWE